MCPIVHKAATGRYISRVYSVAHERSSKVATMFAIYIIIDICKKNIVDIYIYVNINTICKYIYIYNMQIYIYNM